MTEKGLNLVIEGLDVLGWYDGSTVVTRYSSDTPGYKYWRGLAQKALVQRALDRDPQTSALLSRLQG